MGGDGGVDELGGRHQRFGVVRGGRGLEVAVCGCGAGEGWGAGAG